MLKVQEIREIIKLIDQSSITEFNYEADGANISLKKGNGAMSNVQVAPTTVNDSPKIETQEVTEPTTIVENKVEDKKTEAQGNETSVTQNTDYDFEVVSPMVGTFYSSPSPEDDVYVSVGSKVEPESIVCIVEAMKLFNEIEAEVSGEIVEIIAENGELVEYGQPLFRVKKK